MAIPTTRADFIIWTIIGVLLVLDWFIGGTAYDRPLTSRSDRDSDGPNEAKVEEDEAA